MPKSSGVVAGFGGVIALVIGGLLWHFLKETSWAIAVEASLEELAHVLGIEKAKMVATISTIVAFGTVVYAIGAVGYGLRAWQQKRVPDFDIEFVSTNSDFVTISEDRVHYFIRLRNMSERTIAWPSIRAHNSLFANQILTEIDPYSWGQPTGAMLIYVGGAIDPKAWEFIKLFDVPYDMMVHENAAIATKHRFTLEARGQNAETLEVDFEYDPSKFPRLKKC
jgi:hypothetical protein